MPPSRVDTLSRLYADLGIMISEAHFSEELIHKLTLLLEEFKYKLAALTITSLENLENMKRLIEKYSDSIEYVLRLNIRVKERRQLLKLLRRRRLVTLVSVECSNREILRTAVRDRRVDLVYIPINKRIDFGIREAKAATGHDTLSLEFRFWDLTKMRIDRIRRIYRWVLAAKKYKVPIILTSGAKSLNEIRAPRDMAPLLTLFDLTLEEALTCISKNPLRIVNINKEKLSKNYIMPGVKIVGKSEPYEISTKIPGIQTYKPRKLK